MNLERRLASLERKIGKDRECPACDDRKPPLVVVIDDQPVPPPRRCEACGRVGEGPVVVRIE